MNTINQVMHYLKLSSVGCVIFLLVIFLSFLLTGCISSSKKVDAIAGATVTMSNPAAGTYNTNSKRLIILFSAKNSNTAKVANSLAKILGANVKSPQQVDPDELEKYDLVGFGSGIFDGKHHSSMIEFADELPLSPDKKVFIFSTSGISRESLPKQDDPHTSLRACLIAKGVEVIGEFNCVGFNDNSFLKLFGGMNRGRPNNDDLKQAEAFAAALICTA